MPTAVHISFSENKGDLFQNFNYRCFTILAARHPGHHFIFVFDKPFDQSVIIHDNITAVLLPPQIKNRLLSWYWYNYKIPRLLIRYNADIFISDGNICSLRTAVKQCMILPDLSFLQKENLFSKGELKYLNKYFRRFVAKAECIAVTNQYAGDLLAENFPQTKSKIHPIGYGSNELVKKFNDEEIRLIKEKATEGKEYFLCYITAASAPNTTVLLKAFSAFKKRQLSNMQLVLLLSDSQKENPVKDFDNYKYRHEVKVIASPTTESAAEITAAAYAAVYLPSIKIMEDPGLQALKNNIPLITADNEFCKTIYHDAALYTITAEQNIAAQLMLVYKDENLRNDLINQGRQLSTAFSWHNTASKLWKALTASTQ